MSIFIGGTGSANELHDYEEGTWTPSAIGFSINNTLSAKYTKIGRIVHCQCYITTQTGSGASTVEISGFPFTQVSSNNYSYGTGRLGTGSYNNSQNMITFQMQSGHTKIKPYVNDGGINEQMISGTHILFSVVYETTA